MTNWLDPGEVRSFVTGQDRNYARKMVLEAIAALPGPSTMHHDCTWFDDCAGCWFGRIWTVARVVTGREAGDV